MSIPAGIGYVSGDSHVNEPRELWRDNLPRMMRGQAMTGIRAGEEGSWDLVLNGVHVGMGNQTEDERLATARPDHRYAVMRTEGIAGECIFPTVGLYVWMLEDPAVGLASCEVYNEWVLDQLGGSARFKCAGLVPTWDVAVAIRACHDIAASGLGAVMLPAAVAPDWNHPQWEPLWSAIEDTDLPVVMHQGTGHSMFFYRGLGAGVSNLLATQTMAPRTAALLATSGVLARHPRLHVVFVEYNIGWLAWTMQTIDSYTEAFDRYGTTPGGKRWIDPELPEPPSAYLRRQVHATFQDDPVGLHNLPLTGVESLIWGSDYPHEEGTYPRSRETVARLAAPLDAPSATAVFRDNAARLFHFDPRVLATPL